jgi:hypothetical protein
MLFFERIRVSVVTPLRVAMINREVQSMMDCFVGVCAPRLKRRMSYPRREVLFGCCHISRRFREPLVKHLCPFCLAPSAKFGRSDPAWARAAPLQAASANNPRGEWELIPYRKKKRRALARRVSLRFQQGRPRRSSAKAGPEMLVSDLEHHW